VRLSNAGAAYATGTMETGTREQRFVFGEVAELYDRARPGYSAELVDEVLGYVGLDADRVRALEVGAGTGKATVAFAARGLEILALEPSPQMATIAERNCRDFPGVRIERTTFENWAVEPGGFGLVFSAQAWHWVDPEVRNGKAARALRPGGTLALMGHRVLWQGESLRDELEELYRRVAPDLRLRDPGFPGLGRGLELERELEDDRPSHQVEETGLFEDVTRQSHPWPARFTADGFVERLATQSDHRLVPEDTREELFAAARELVAAHGGEIVIPHATVLTLGRVPRP